MAFEIIHTRVDEKIHTAIREVAEASGLSMVQVVSATIAKAAGLDSFTDAAIERAWRERRRAAAAGKGAKP